MTSPQVFQIFYDDATRRALDPGFLPLDNSRNERPDWYEMWVIRSFLHDNALAEDRWYGFLSPHFGEKTGLTSAQVHEFLGAARERYDVALLLYGWDQLAYFLNPFEQGEVWVPGITALSQSVLGHLGHDVDLDDMVTFSGNFTFSNYIVAKAPYWRKWLAIADRFFALSEDPASALSADLRQMRSYGAATHKVPIKAFIQERLPAIVLSDRGFRTTTLDTSSTFPIFGAMFDDGPATRGVLQTCDLLKRRYWETGEANYLRQFEQLRRLVPTKFRAPAPRAG